MNQKSPHLSPALRVFLAEDNLEMRRMLAIALRKDGHFVLEAADGAALLADIGHVFGGPERDSCASVVVTDVRLPGRDGLAILRSLRAQPWCPPFILITAYGDRALHDEARELGAQAVFDKPFDLQVLRAKVGSFRRRPGAIASLSQVIPACLDRSE